MTWERKILRKIYGPTKENGKWRIKTSAELITKCTRAVHKETELYFFLIYCFTYILIKLVSFKVLPSTLYTPLATFFSSSGTRPGTCFAGWREGPVWNFLLSPLPSEIGDLLVRISTSGKRRSPQEPNLESRTSGGQ